jgi:DtxR family Mn-dependent transcriptional regulator
MGSFTEENYLKIIYKLSQGNEGEVTTNAIAEITQTKPSSVSDMLRKLSEKKLIDYRKYQGVRLTEEGLQIALQVIRNHRLWEVFLAEKLRFNWDQVHDLAEQLEHIHHPDLINRLDEFLGFPAYDPHGDPIPNASGLMQHPSTRTLYELELSQKGTIRGVRESSDVFLRYLDKLGLRIGIVCQVIDRIAFDGSLELKLDEERRVIVSQEASRNILIV